MKPVVEILTIPTLISLTSAEDTFKLNLVLKFHQIFILFNLYLLKDGEQLTLNFSQNTLQLHSFILICIISEN